MSTPKVCSNLGADEHTTSARLDASAGLCDARLQACRWLLQHGILTDDLPERAREVTRAMQADWTHQRSPAYAAPLDVERESLALYWFARHWHVKDPHDKLAELWLRCAGPRFTLEALVGFRRFLQTLSSADDPERSCHHQIFEKEQDAWVRLRGLVSKRICWLVGRGVRGGATRPPWPRNVRPLAGRTGPAPPRCRGADSRSSHGL